MWGNFGGLNLKDLAEKARAAAEHLDQQLNESVGIETPAKESSQPPKVDMEGLDDAWGDDDDDLLAADDDGDEMLEETTDVTPPPAEGQSPRTRSPTESNYDDKQFPRIEPQEHALENGWEEEEDNLHVDDLEAEEAHNHDSEPLTKDEEKEAAPTTSDETLTEPETSVREDIGHALDADPPHEDEVDLRHSENEASPHDQHHVDSEDEAVRRQEYRNSSELPNVVMEQDKPLLPDGMDMSSSQMPVTTDDAVAAAEQSALAEAPHAASVGTFAPDDRKDNREEDEIGQQTSISYSPAHEAPQDLEPSLLQQHDTAPADNDQAALLQEQLEQMQAKLQQTQMALQQREDQLMNKTEQLTEMESLHEKEKEDLRQKIKDTKEEAKKRIQKAKERVEAAELQLQNIKAVQNSSEDDAGKQAEIIAELRAEGESLARKQADMEMAVRAAKGEARELRETLEHELDAKEKALSKVEQLEKDLKETKDNLAAARRGESMADKFEEQLRKAKEEDERKGSQILSLEQQLKELKAEARDLMAELDSSQKGAAVEAQQTVKRLRKEHSEAISEMEAKLHKTEKDAHTREDALRKEVDEIRKRWQDAVRRADSLSMDIQSSTAPLLRQLESAERQSRARAAAAAEIETKLRSELEDTILAKENLVKERNEFKSKLSLLERSAKENDAELMSTKQALEERTSKVKQLEEKVEALESEMSKKQEQWKEVERLANEGVSRVRSEMTQTVIDSEERHRSQLGSVQKELSQEREKRRQLEQQLSGLLENASMLVPTPNHEPLLQIETKPKKLKQSEGQAEILAGALGGLGRSHDGDESDDDGDLLVHIGLDNNSGNSFAALAEMQSRMKATKQELEDLRRSLIESEKAKERLVIDLRDSRNAKEKLPLFEARCQELTEENRRLEVEVNVLTEEMEEMRLVYRSQLEAYMMASSSAEIPTLQVGDEQPQPQPPLLPDNGLEAPML